MEFVLEFQHALAIILVICGIVSSLAALIGLVTLAFDIHDDTNDQTLIRFAAVIAVLVIAAAVFFACAWEINTWNMREVFTCAPTVTSGAKP